MKNWILPLAVVAAMGVTSLSVLPLGLAAAETPVAQVEIKQPTPVEVQPKGADFSDAEFEKADQPEQGAKTGGDVIVISSVAVVVIVVVVVLLLLL